MYGYFCIAFIEYMSKAKILLDYTDLFCANEYEKSVWMTHTYFKDKNNRGKVYTWVKHKSNKTIKGNSIHESNIRQGMSRRNNKSVLRSKKHKNVWMALNCIEQLLTITYFCCYWKCFNFWFCFISWYSYRYCKFCSWIKICAINERIKKVIQCLRKREKKGW